MAWVKSIHVACAYLSLLGFFVRGLWMLADSPLLQSRRVKVTPHVIDTVLLLSAIVLAVNWPGALVDQPWLLAKISALLLYIGLGLVALRFGRTKRLRAVAWLAGLLVFAYILSVAFSKSVYGLLA